jgi:two-component system, chemotaxis family, CheB/CheR fusion protein
MHKLSTSLAVLEHELSELRLILERQTGVLLDTPNEVLADLISRWLEELRINSPADFLDRLRSSQAECERFLEPLLDGTTRFFAHPEAFDSLTRLALPELEKQISPNEQPRTLRMWSAGCSTGEEAYSIAISLCESLNIAGGEWSVRIFAGDIRHEAIKIAERGLYPEAALSQIPRPLLQSYFARLGQHFLVKPRIRNMVSFTTMNLTKMDYVGRFHCIFCMDVLSRFSRSQRTAMVQRLHLYLEPGGFLFLGESEKLPASNVQFEVRQNYNYTIYRKPMAAGAASGQ